MLIRSGQDPLLEMYLFEMTQHIEQLEQIMLESEYASCFTQIAVNEIFRMMHTIKGSSAMMQFDGITNLAHSLEDLFFLIREENRLDVDCTTLTDLVLNGIDFMKIEIEKIKNNDQKLSTAETLIASCRDYLALIKGDEAEPSERCRSVEGETELSFLPHYEALESAGEKTRYRLVVQFMDGSEMENIRAYALVHNLSKQSQDITFLPAELLEEEALEIIRREGFRVCFSTTANYGEVYQLIDSTSFIKNINLLEINADSREAFLLPSLSNKPDELLPGKVVDKQEFHRGALNQASGSPNIISVNVGKLDKLMDLVGEMVIAESMVIQNSDLKGLELNNFNKAARELNKITDEIQDIVISIRMIPLTVTFQKMNRIVRDMSRKLNKEIELKIIGENTEVDKNVIEHISDPLMHLVRNALDHGIEAPEERKKKNKSSYGTITLEARNAGSDVVVIVKDDGRGLNKERILKRAEREGSLTKRIEEMSDREIYNLILQPGFSTKEEVTEFSGRGVGMDVVARNIDAIGGSISVESSEGEGTVITLKLPLTLAIIDGMNIRAGLSYFTIPTDIVKEAFRLRSSDLITTPEGSEMLLVRGNCYPLLRLRDHLKLQPSVIKNEKDIIIMVEANDRIECILVDEMLGLQPVVVKALPKLMKNLQQSRYLSGCTLLGDGSISLILDIPRLMQS